jgi:oligopeptide/dipeptide ABC transporter ATP-binding protein
MYLGSIVETAPSDLLYTNHRHPYTEALLSAIPIADPEVEAKRERILLSGDVPNPVGIGNECAFAKRCPYATEQCRCEKPQLKEIEPGHFVACHNRT